MSFFSFKAGCTADLKSLDWGDVEAATKLEWAGILFWLSSQGFAVGFTRCLISSRQGLSAWEGFVIQLLVWALALTVLYILFLSMGIQGTIACAPH